MVKILLMYTRAQRDGIWELHIISLGHMHPYFARCYHLNYFSSGTVYLAEMKQLPPEVERSFKNGDWVVKMSKTNFKQVDPDQAQEWLNGTGKKGGGIIGITKTVTALSRWALSFNIRANIADDTRKLFGLNLDDSLVHKEATSSRKRLDSQAEDKVVAVLKRFGVFTEERAHTDELCNITTKDQAMDEINEALLHARVLGQTQVENFVRERLIRNDSGKTTLNYKDVMKKNKPLTLSILYEIP